jgi:hypothetical protein
MSLHNFFFIYSGQVSLIKFVSVAKNDSCALKCLSKWFLCSIFNNSIDKHISSTTH